MCWDRMTSWCGLVDSNVIIFIQLHQPEHHSLFHNIQYLYQPRAPPSRSLHPEVIPAQSTTLSFITSSSYTSPEHHSFIHTHTHIFTHQWRLAALGRRYMLIESKPYNHTKIYIHGALGQPRGLKHCPFAAQLRRGAVGPGSILTWYLWSCVKWLSLKAKKDRKKIHIDIHSSNHTHQSTFIHIHTTIHNNLH